MKDTTRELTRMAQFFGIETAPTRLQEVINRSSADRMRELEKLEADRWIATKNRRKDIPFVRVAKAGGWRTSLPVKSVEQIENAWGDLMITLGYEPVTVQVPQGVR